jgi:hypothetical protein
MARGFSNMSTFHMHAQTCTYDAIALATADVAELFRTFGNKALIYTASQRHEVVRLADVASAFS